MWKKRKNKTCSLALQTTFPARARQADAHSRRLCWVFPSLRDRNAPTRMFTTGEKPDKDVYG
jgi:hypothetical protein